VKSYLKQELKFDIDQDPIFQTSNEIYKAMLVKLQRNGYGKTEHKEPISKEDMQKLYAHPFTFKTSTPVGLQNKVFFEIMLYLCRRGRENLHNHTKLTFAVKSDTTGREYVCQVMDELDKNHGVDAAPNDTIGDGRMYARPGSNLCPVASFKLYVSKLNPECAAFWQRPLNAFEDDSDVWFCKVALGKNTLGKMMATISTSSNLSTIYTNHSIRASCITALDQAGFEARHICRVSGHKSENSIRSYSERLSEEQSRNISDQLATYTTFNQTVESLFESDPITDSDLQSLFPFN
jgi:hypothetical protein